MEQTTLTPHDLTLPGTKYRDLGVWNNDPNLIEKGVDYFFHDKDGELKHVKPVKIRKYDMDVEVDGVRYKWTREIRQFLLFYFTEDAIQAKQEAEAEKNVRRLQIFRQNLVESIKSAQENITEWANKLATTDHPLHELSWSRQVFAYAANLKVYKKVLVDFDAGLDVDRIINKLTAEVVNLAGRVANKSTSQTSNLADENELNAVANFIDRYKYYAPNVI